jgi:hypothetical protein
LSASVIAKSAQFDLLSLPCWDGRGVDTVADTSDASSDDKLSSRTTSNGDGRDLDNDTDDHDYCTQKDTVAASELVTNLEDQAGTQEATDRVDGDNEAFVSAVSVYFRESLDEGGRGDDTAHDTLVVSEEEEIGDGNDSDEDLKHPTGLSPVGGDTTDALLGSWWHDGGCVVQSWSEELLRRMYQRGESVQL